MWTVTISVEDRKGKQSSFSFNFNSSRTIAQIESWVNSLTFPMNAITRGAIRAISIVRAMSVPILMRATPEDDADVEEKAFTGMRSVAGYPTKTTIPTLNENVVAVGTRVLDQTNALVLQLISLIEDGLDVSGTIVKPSDNRGSDIQSVVTLEEVFVSSKGE